VNNKPSTCEGKTVLFLIAGKKEGVGLFDAKVNGGGEVHLLKYVMRKSFLDSLEKGLESLRQGRNKEKTVLLQSLTKKKVPQPTTDKSGLFITQTIKSHSSSFLRKKLGKKERTISVLERGRWASSSRRGERVIMFISTFSETFRKETLSSHYCGEGALLHLFLRPGVEGKGGSTPFHSAQHEEGEEGGKKGKPQCFVLRWRGGGKGHIGPPSLEAEEGKKRHSS